MKVKIPDGLKQEYFSELKKIFYIRTNLLSIIAIAAFSLELVLGLTVFRDILSKKDMPGIIGGISFGVILLATGRLNRSFSLQKGRALIFSLLLLLIASLAALAHPEIIQYLGISLVLFALFASALLFPWTALETCLIGLFALISFIAAYLSAGIFRDGEIFGIETILFGVAVLVAAGAKRSEEILSVKAFLSQKEVEEKSAAMAKELELARKIHAGLMPESFSNEFADIAVTYKPMLYIGGDYARFYFREKSRLLFIVSDVTGHGVSSALLVNRVHTEIERLARDGKGPGDVSKSLADFIERDFGKMGYYLSAFCGELDFDKKRLAYSNHGHPPQILVHSKDDSIEFMESHTFLMGIGMDPDNLYSSEIPFSRGDRLVLFTDGIIEAKDEKGELFGYDALKEFVRSHRSLAAADFNKALLERISAYQNDKQSDDIFLLTIEVK